MMREIEVHFTWLLPEECADLPLPTYHSEHASGMDIAAGVQDPVVLEPGRIIMIPTGFAVAIPPGYELQVRPRSGMAIKKGITVVNTPGTIDADYRGEVKVGLINLSDSPFIVNRGDRVAQMVLCPVMKAVLTVTGKLEATGRQDGGFGHTGR